MKFLADLNIPVPAVKRLTDAGHDVLRIVRSTRPITDAEILDRATELRRTVITFDSDFGELIFGQGRMAPYGVIYLRLVNYARTEPAQRILALLQTADDPFTGYFTTIDRDKVRVRRVYRSPG